MGWTRIFRRRHWDQERSRELESYLQMETDENVARGMSPEEARYAARRKLGNTMLIREEIYRMNSIGMLETLWRHTKYAVRMLGKNPGFSAVAVITLALGIGATSAIYSVVYATLLAPLPYPEPEQLVMVWLQLNHKRIWWASAGDFLDWKQQSTVFQDLSAAAAGGLHFNLAKAGSPEEVIAQASTPGYYRMMGVRFLLGRNFLEEEGSPGKDHVVILTYKLWKRLGADTNIIGRQLRMNGEPYSVVGVTAPGPLDRIQFDLVVPLVFKTEQINHGYRWLFVMGRLKPRVSLTEAQADMSVVARRVAHDNPETNKDFEVSVEALQNDFLPSDTKTTLWLLLGAVGFVLLIACVNVANLLLARSTVRQKEVAVRVSIGASRGQLFAQFLTESLVLAILGGALGVGLAGALVRVIVAILPEYTLPSEADVKISLAVLLFTLLVSISAGVLFGCAPAWQASGVDPNRALKEGGSTGAGRGRRRLRQALVILEFGLALTLLAGAGLAIRSFWNLTHVELGVRTDHFLTFSVPVPDTRLLQPEQMVAFYRELLAGIQALPGVSATVAATGLPVQGTRDGTQFHIAGTPPEPDPRLRPSAAFLAVTPGYFETFSIRMIKGRSFTGQDADGRVPVAVVNENFVRRYLPNVDPLSQRIIIEKKVLGIQTQQPPVVEWQIVGVFRNVRNFGLRNDDVPEMDVPFWQSPWPQAEIAVRTVGDPMTLTKNIADVVGSMERDLPLANVKTMEQIVDDRLAGDRFSTVLYGSFAGVALLLAAVGIYGVMAFVVAQRTHEIGLRIALGAGCDHVLRLILGEGLTLAVLGLGFGAIGAYFAGRVLRSLLYGVAAMDFGVFGAVSLTLLTSAILACYLPARRAAHVDPLVALRHE